MKATQGVILIMIAALALWLTWSSRSVLQSFADAPRKTPTPTPSGTGTTTGGALPKGYVPPFDLPKLPTWGTNPQIVRTPDGLTRLN